MLIMQSKENYSFVCLTNIGQESGVMNNKKVPQKYNNSIYGPSQKTDKETLESRELLS